jgi:hypothetical protein
MKRYGIFVHTNLPHELSTCTSQYPMDQLSTNTSFRLTTSVTTKLELTINPSIQRSHFKIKIYYTNLFYEYRNTLSSFDWSIKVYYVKPNTQCFNQLKHWSVLTVTFNLEKLVCIGLNDTQPRDMKSRLTRWASVAPVLQGESLITRPSHPSIVTGCTSKYIHTAQR